MKHITLALGMVFLLGPAWSQLPRGAEVPDFSLTDVKGKPHKLSTILSDKKVKAVWVTVWDVGCSDCRTHLPQMARTFKGLKGKGLRWIGVALRTSRSQAQNFADKNGLSPLGFLNLLDPDRKVAWSLKTKATPYSLLVGKNRRVLAVYQGASPAILAAMRTDATTFVTQGQVTPTPVRAGKG